MSAAVDAIRGGDGNITTHPHDWACSSHRIVYRRVTSASKVYFQPQFVAFASFRFHARYKAAISTHQSRLPSSPPQHNHHPYPSPSPSFLDRITIEITSIHFSTLPPPSLSPWAYRKSRLIPSSWTRPRFIGSACCVARSAPDGVPHNIWSRLTVKQYVSLALSGRRRQTEDQGRCYCCLPLVHPSPTSQAVWHLPHFICRASTF